MGDRGNLHKGTLWQRRQQPHGAFLLQLSQSSLVLGRQEISRDGRQIEEPAHLCKRGDGAWLALSSTSRW